MLKRRQKLVSGLLAVAFALATIVSGVAPVTAAEQAAQAADRLAGVDRYETAAKIAAAGWGESKAANAILTNGEDDHLVDALTAAPLAYQLNAPILFTEEKELNSFAAKTLEDLEVKDIYVTTGAIDSKVLEELGKDYTVHKLGGIDRFATAANIADELEVSDKIVVATAWNNADALSIASIAARDGMPIFLSEVDKLDASVAKYIKDNGVKTSYVLGGKAIINETVEKELPSAKRLFGIDRYATNLEILKEFNVKYDNVYVANGEDDHLVDALAGAPFAAKAQAPIILANDSIGQATKELAYSKLTPSSKVIAFGGEAVVPSTVVETVAAVTKVQPADFGVMQFSGVNGYSVGFNLVDGKKAKDLKSVEVSLYQGDKLLATNTSTYKLLSEYPEATTLSTPFNIDGSFSDDRYWVYGSWNGTIADVPTKAVITVSYLDGSKAVTVDNNNLTGEPAALAVEALKHVNLQNFDVMQADGVNGYNVAFNLVDGNKVNVLTNIAVSLYKGDTLLASNTSTAKLLTSTAAEVSSPFNVNGTFDGKDGLWNYGKWNGSETDVPDQAVISVTYLNGNTYVLTSNVKTIQLGEDVIANEDNPIKAKSSTTEKYVGAGSWEPVINEKMELYIDPAKTEGLGSIKLSDIASISYATKNAGTTANVDFGLEIYTAGDAHGWYGERLSSEPMYSNNYKAEANQWNTWSTFNSVNQLVFYDSNHGSAGFAGGPTLADLQKGEIAWENDTVDYSKAAVKYLKLQTSTGGNWQDFAGNLDKITIALTNGSVVVIDLE